MLFRGAVSLEYWGGLRKSSIIDLGVLKALQFET